MGREHTPRIAILAAVARNGVIGKGNSLPWRLPSDLKRVKALTLGHTLVMGRRTHQSIGRPLPGRRTIVVTSRTPDETLAGVEVARSLSAALERAGRPVFLFGGQRIYEEGLALADTLYLTRIDAAPQGDAAFPKFNAATFELAERTEGQRTGGDEHDFAFETWVRVTTP